jgi:hypothetical protein
MRRKILNLAAAMPWVAVLWVTPAILSAALLLGSLFARAEHVIDHATAAPATWRVTFRPGCLDVYRLGASVPTSAIPFFARLNATGSVAGLWPGESRIVSGFAGISQLDGHFLQGSRGAVPFSRWTLSLRTACFLSCILALPCAASLHRHRRRPELSPPGCDVCGYDLRATPERCPECGTAPEVRRYEAGA